jgi:hypothetical protein
MRNARAAFGIITVAKSFFAAEKWFTRCVWFYLFPVFPRSA